MNETKWNEIRLKYPVFEDRIYLRTNGGGPLSDDYTAAFKKALSDASSRGRIWEEYLPYLKESRGLLAKMFNSETNEIAFTHSVSLAVNHLAGMLPKNYKILTFKDEYPSNTIPFLEQGFDVQFLESSAIGEIPIEKITKVLQDDVQVLIVSHVEYRTGFKHDLRELGKICKENDVIFIVDATQSAGVVKIDFKETNADAILFSTHKWLNSGYSMACMIVSSAFLENHKPSLVGWKSVDFLNENDHRSYKLKEDASVFELGHPDFLSTAAFVAQLQLITFVGLSNIEERIKSLRAYFEKKCKISGIKIISNFEENNKSGMTVLGVSREVHEKLVKRKIDCTYRDKKLMVAISYYNNEQDIDFLIDVIAS